MSILNIVPALKAVSPLTYNQYLFEVPGTYNWVCPPFVNAITVVCIGGGGGGGRDVSGDNIAAGGGGGALCYQTNLPVTPGTSYSLTVGAGGKGGVSPTGGANSTFTHPTRGTLTAGGGYAPVKCLGGLGGKVVVIAAAGGFFGYGYGGVGGGFDLSAGQLGGGSVGQTGGGGGGAGGYGANGGKGGTGRRGSTSGSKGAGGGGGASWYVYGNGNGTPSGGGGGGAGEFQDNNAAGGAGGSTAYTPTGGAAGAAGAYGQDGSSNLAGGNVGGRGGKYGGGGGGSNGAGNGGGYTAGDGNDGGDGAVAIIIENTIWGLNPTFLKKPISNNTPTTDGGAANTSYRVAKSETKIPLLGTGGATWVPAGWNQSVNASNDDAYITITNLPFSFYFNGTAYNSIYIGSNQYITFGGGSTSFSGLSSTNPALDKIMLHAADTSFQRIAYWDDGAYVFRLRYEGTHATSGTPGSPTVVYELSIYNPSLIDNSRTIMELITGNWVSSGIVGLYSSTGTNLISSVDNNIPGSFVPAQNSSYVFVSDNSTATSFSVYTGASFAGI